MDYPSTEQIKAAFAGDVHQMNILTVHQAWGALSDTLSDVRYLAAEEETANAPWSKAQWKSYHRINAARD